MVALLDTACRVGEVLSLQWRNVSLERRELVIEAVRIAWEKARVAICRDHHSARLSRGRLRAAACADRPRA
jgi:integrase